MSSQSSIAHSSVGETLGALYVGATISALLSGVTILQAVMYYKRYPDDWWVYRYSVGLLWALETLHVALCTYTLYFFLIHFFGDLVGALEYNVWSMKWQLSVNDFLIVYIQGLYAIRLWQLGRHFHKTLICFVSLAVVASLGTAILRKYVMSVISTAGDGHTDNFDINLYLFLYNRCHGSDNSSSNVLLPAQEQSRYTRTVYSYSTSPLDAIRSHVRISYKLPPLNLIPSHAQDLTNVDSTSCGRSPWLSSGFISSCLSVVYINSLLAMLNSRSKHHSTSQYETNSMPTLVRIPPHSSEGNVEETNISVSLQDIGSFANQVDPLKEYPDCRG
ncbi:hypothetical protein EDD85DRAFT_944984 [Armillaria nabsnona]|nr:hypothetical protein EDD85DRAFT_944984 [Armillaria nabsnona]